METITLDAVIDENHQLVVQVPDMPPGRVKVTVEPIEKAGTDEPPPEPMTREWARAKLKAAGLLAEDEPFPDAMEVDEEELERVGNLFAGDRPMSELIDEDREERF